MPELLLTLTGARAEAERIRLSSSPFVVGRDTSSDLVIPEPWVSRRQLVFERHGDQWTVRLEGRNPVEIDGRPLTEATPLVGGERIVLGPATIAVELVALSLDDGALGEPTLELPLARVEPGSALQALAEASATLYELGDPREVARQVAQLFAQRLALESAAVLERSGDGAEILGSSGHPITRVSRRLLRLARDRQATLCLADGGASPPAGATDASGAFGSDSSVSLTLAAIGPVLVAPTGPDAAAYLYASRPIGARPFDPEEAAFATVLAQILGSALAVAAKVASLADARQRLDEERRELRRDIDRRGSFGSLIGSSAPMQRVATAITKVAPSDATVLITGETGSGKELVAREVHRRSKRQQAPFFALNCAALPDTLIESELFGHRRGAFSGADKDRRGVFELAQGGTVFLDEIGELPLVAQAKVLRALDAREVQPLGGGHPIKIDVRLVAATHRDLAAEVSQGRFRQDLLYRLKVFPIALSPLRERKEDLPALARAFFEASSEAQLKRLGAPTPAALAALADYEFPGNVRELAHLIAHAVILADDGEAIDVRHFPEEIGRKTVPRPRAAPRTDPGALSYPSAATLRDMVGELEREVIIRELGKDGWNRTRTAKRLEVSLRAFMDKLKRYEIREE